MKMTSGRVVDGQIIVDYLDEPLPEGMEVIVGIPEEGDGVELTAEQLAELDESLAEADRGELIPAEDVLQRLRAHR
jgi:hypothetical protein